MTTHLQLLRTAIELPDGFDRTRHRASIEEIAPEHPHSITYRGMGGDGTCTTYTFGLTDNPTYRAIAMNFGGEVFAGRGFVEWLIRTHLREIEEPIRDCAVRYFSGQQWQHIGSSAAPGRVISKWGTFPVYDHALFELPARYGDTVRYFDKPSNADALRLFLEYARIRGLSSTDIAWATSEGA